MLYRLPARARFVDARSDRGVADIIVPLPLRRARSHGGWAVDGFVGRMAQPQARCEVSGFWAR